MSDQQRHTGPDDSVFNTVLAAVFWLAYFYLLYLITP